MRSHIKFKLSVSYLFILLLPITLFIILTVYESKQYIQEERDALKIATLNQSWTDIENDCKSLENIYMRLRQNSNFLGYLNGNYVSQGEQLSLYKSEFISMFKYMMYQSPHLESIRIYTENNNLVNFYDIINSKEALKQDLDEEVLSDGYWVYVPEESMFMYYHTIHDATFHNQIGILEIACSCDLILEKLAVLASLHDTSVYLRINGMTWLYQEDTLVPCDNSEPKNAIVKSSEDLEMSILLTDNFTYFDYFKDIPFLLLILIGFTVLILILSTLFFFIVSKLVQRITKFSSHISQTQIHPEPYLDDNGYDELHLLVKSYNEMLQNNLTLLDQVKLDQLLQSEMSYQILQLQIDPHFIYNTLESIRMLAEIHDEEQISQMIFSLSRIMRYAFSTNTNSITLSNELELVEMYISICRMRMGSRFEATITYAPELEEVKIPKFIIQPLVENAIKYGYSDINETLIVSIVIEQRENRVCIIVRDKGIGMESQKMEQINTCLREHQSIKHLSSGTGIGLDNVANRMRFLYPKTFIMELKDNHPGVEVLLSWELSEI